MQGTSEEDLPAESTNDDETPDEFYFNDLPAMQKAAQALTATHPLKKWKTLFNQAELPQVTHRLVYFSLQGSIRCNTWSLSNNRCLNAART